MTGCDKSVDLSDFGYNQKVCKKCAEEIVGFKLDEQTEGEVPY